MKLRFEKTQDSSRCFWWWSLRRNKRNFGPDEPCKSLPGAKRSARAFLENMANALLASAFLPKVAPPSIDALLANAEVVE